MDRRPIYYLILIFILTLIFHDEQLGLNLLIAAISFVGFSFFDPSTHKPELNWRWYIAASLLIGNATIVFIAHSPLSIGLFFLSFFYFAAIQNNARLSLPIGIMQSIISFFLGFYWSIASLVNRLNQKQNGKQYQAIIRILMYLIPLIVGIIFLKLYQNADDTFREWTRFIRLDWISWSFIGFYVLLLFLVFGFYYIKGSPMLERTEYRLKNDILTTYTDRIQDFLTLKNERQIAKSLLITLIALLLIYNAVDIRFIWVELLDPAVELSYSEIVHGGINSLITSIVLVILIITFLFRGGLNFENNRGIKILTLIWLSLNVLMVSTTIIKNHAYISELGLTYKRIGVYIYLILALGGLILTFIKVLQIKSFWFLLRSGSLLFLLTLTVVGAISWNKIIAQHNLNLESNTIDLEYIFDLGPDTYPLLLDYYAANHSTEQENLDFWQKVTRNFDYVKYDLERDQEIYTWKSFNIRDYLLLQKMNTYHIINSENKDSYEMDYR